MPGQDKLRKGYHDILRRDILELIPRSASCICDLGCGTGELGKALKARQKCRVHGIELNKKAVEIAQDNLDVTIRDNLNRYDPSELGYKYDCLVFGDILEHLINPWGVLKKFTEVLTEGSTVIASIPNIAHPWILSQLQKGLWRYEPAGILDASHLRFFTKTSICQMFVKAGLHITNIIERPSKDNPIQYFIVAEKAQGEHEAALATILILSWNTLELTRRTIQSIKENTNIPYKIIAIDNGSTDGSVQMLRLDKEILLIENSCNLGFARGFNVGLECVDTPFFVLANSDIYVTSGWLARMLQVMSHDDNIWGVGPVTNYASGPQGIECPALVGAEAMESFAEEHRKRIIEPLMYFRRLVFFLALFRTEALANVGFLDERFEGGNFEDDDYCIRIARVGKKLAIDNSTFIFHVGSASFVKNNVDYAKAMETNRRKFMEKWKLKEPVRE